MYRIPERYLINPQTSLPLTVPSTPTSSIMMTTDDDLVLYDS